MTFTDFLIYAGISAYIYAIGKLLAFWSLKREDKGHNNFFSSFLIGAAWVLFVLSFPVSLLLGAISKLNIDRTYQKHVSDMKHLRYVLSVDAMPEELRKKHIGNEEDDFDYESWKRHELSQLGLD